MEDPPQEPGLGARDKPCTLGLGKLWPQFKEPAIWCGALAFRV